MSEELPASELGTVTYWVNGKHGYGYIHPEDGSDAVFVHHTSMAPGGEKMTLAKGVRITYEVGRRKLGGLWAKNVRVAS